MGDNRSRMSPGATITDKEVSEQGGREMSQPEALKIAKENAKCSRAGDKIAGAWFRCSVGRNETAILDALESDTRTKICRQFAVCVDKCTTYHLDGYSLESNTAYEVYEAGHAYTLARDVSRENAIREVLGCGFRIVYDFDTTTRQPTGYSKQNVIAEYIRSGEIKPRGGSFFFPWIPTQKELDRQRLLSSWEAKRSNQQTHTGTRRVE
jgi:hypothetical protein